MRKFSFPLLCVFYAFILFFSCRKPDIVQAPDAKTLTKEERFFAVRATASPQAKAIAEAIKRQNANYHFVTDVIKKAGYPIWDKARIHNNINGTASGRTASDSLPDEVVYVPFVLDSGSTTNAVLSVAFDGPDTTYRIAYARGYRAFGYDTATTGWNARKAFALFAGFDYTVFGHKKFSISDTLLFTGAANRSNNIIATLKEHNGHPVAGRTTDILECWSVQVCWEINAARTTSFTHCETYNGCFPFGSGSPIGGGSGGGNPVGGWWPTGGGTGGNGNGSDWWNADPCPPSASARTMTNPIACIAGWMPVPVNNGMSTGYSYLVNTLNLNPTEQLWLAESPFEALQIYEALQESLNQDPIDENTFSTSPPPEALAAAQITIAAAMNGLINGQYDNAHYNLIKQYIPGAANHPNIDPVWWAHFMVRCALIKIEHPEYSNIRVYWEAVNEMVHLGLDVVGLFPVVGEVADLLNGGIYTLQGDGVNATLSFASAVPVAGWYAAGLKFAKKGINLVNGTTTLKWLKQTDNYINFGDRGQLRKVLGLVKGDARKAHHVIPWDFWDNPVVQTAAKHNDAFHLNELLNGIPLSHAVHSGTHSNYITKIRNRLNTIINFNPNLTPADAKLLLTNLINDIKTAIQNNPNTHIDNLVF